MILSDLLDRYTMIDGEALEEARRKVFVYRAFYWTNIGETCSVV